MSELNDLKKAIADGIRRSGCSTIIANKLYTAEELAREVEKESDVGKKIIEMAIKGTVERYLGRKSMKS